jgi:preprotein translocase subunit SecG
VRAKGRVPGVSGTLTILLLVIGVALVAAVLLQSPRGAGLGGAIGGSAEQIFGKRRGVDAFLSRLTIALGIAFFLVALLIAYLSRLPGGA